MKDRSTVAVVASWAARFRSGMPAQRAIHRLEAEVEARKRPSILTRSLARQIFLVLVAVVAAHELGARAVDSDASWAARAESRDRLQTLEHDVAALQGRLDIQTAEMERLQRAHDASARYDIAADLALMIEEVALSESIDPKLAFELVRVESEFNERAVSPVGALGYTQLMPETARLLVPGITRERIFDRETNLRLGFRFLRSLVNHYHGDIRLALLAYNRGPARVDALLAAGIDPSNGYTRLVLGK